MRQAAFPPSGTFEGVAGFAARCCSSGRREHRTEKLMTYALGRALNTTTRPQSARLPRCEATTPVLVFGPGIVNSSPFR